MPRNRLSLLLPALIVSLLASSPAAAQDRRQLSPEDFKQGDNVRSAFRQSVAVARLSTVRVLGDGKAIALGLIVAEDGYILTKHSELVGPVSCELVDGRKLPARVVGLSPRHDLAMLKVEARDLKAAALADARGLAVGQWLGSVGPGELPVAVGVVSIPRTKIAGRSGFLGVALAEEEDETGVKLAQVFPDSAAHKAGLQVGDVIRQVNGRDTRTRDQLQNAIRDQKPGTPVKLLVLRDEKDIEVSVQLGSAPDTSPRGQRMDTMGGELSDRRTDFPMVLQHDATLDPDDCGGPVVDLDGKVVGLNIARAGRVASYAIPADVIAPLLGDLKSGKLAPTTQPAPAPAAKAPPPPAPTTRPAQRPGRRPRPR